MTTQGTTHVKQNEQHKKCTHPNKTNKNEWAVFVPCMTKLWYSVWRSIFTVDAAASPLRKCKNFADLGKSDWFNAIWFE